MTNTDPFASQSSAFKFDKIGDTAKGTIIALDQQQVIDFDTQEPKFYKDGNPIMQPVVTLRQDDGEETRVFCKPAASAAVREAREKAGADRVEVGGRLAVKYSSDKPHERKGYNPIKQFTAQYEAPAPEAAPVDEDGLL